MTQRGPRCAASQPDASRRRLLRLGAALAAGAACAPALPVAVAEPPIGIVCAFGAEADLLLAALRQPRVRVVNGNRYAAGLLAGQRVVIVLTGVGLVNAAMTAQLLIDRFGVGRLLMSGIAGGVNPARRVGDVVVPERWALPMETYWHRDGSLPAPCGEPGDVACLGLGLARGADGRPLPPFALAAPQGGEGGVPTGLHPRDSFVRSSAAPQGELRFDFPADAEMLAVARTLAPTLERCGPRGGAAACVRERPRLSVGGLGVSGPAFVANPQYRRYLHAVLGAETVDMETAALAQVARANGVPFLALRSVSDLAGAETADADVRTLFASGLAEANEAAVAIAFLDAWRRHRRGR